MFTSLYNHLAAYGQLAEFFLACGALLQLSINVFFNKERFATNGIFGFQTFIILSGTLYILFNCDITASYQNLLVINSFQTELLKKVIISFSILALAPIVQGLNIQKIDNFEFYLIYLVSILSSMTLISANDFLVIYLLIELQALCFFILATFRRDSLYSAEAGTKYFIFGSLISCILLYSLSLLYGAVGTLNLHNLSIIFYSFPFPAEYTGVNNSVVLSLALFSVVLFFKLGIVPFHFWAPDVYEGSPLSSTIVFSYLPKLVLFDLFIRISNIFGSAFEELQMLFTFVGILTVFIGSIMAMVQSRMKRFFIYSSISQMGFPIILVGLNTPDAHTAIYFFMLMYTLMSIVTWSAYVFLQHFIKKVELRKGLIDTPLYITDLRGLYYYDKVWAFFFALVFFSLAGIPPLSGFLIKWYALVQLTNNFYYITAFLLLLISCISTFYYIRIIKIIFFETKDSRFYWNPLVIPFDHVWDGTLSYIFNTLVAFICITLLIHAFFFLDAWMLFSQLLTYTGFF